MAMLDRKFEALGRIVSSRAASESQRGRLRARSLSTCLGARIKTLEGYIADLEALGEDATHNKLYRFTLRDCMDELSCLREGIVVSGDRFDATAMNVQRLRGMRAVNMTIDSISGISPYITSTPATPTPSDDESLYSQPDEGYFTRPTSYSSSTNFHPEPLQQHTRKQYWESNDQASQTGRNIFHGFPDNIQEESHTSTINDFPSEEVIPPHVKANEENKTNSRLSKAKMQYRWAQGIEWWQVASKPWMEVRL